MISSFVSPQFLKFLFCGGIAAVVNFGTRFIFNIWFDFPVAIVLAYICGMITAFILAKMFVFKTSQLPLQHSALRFLIISLLTFSQTLVISLGLAFYILPMLGITLFVKEIAHAGGIIMPLFSSYIGHKRWSFS